jgi:hypothetical protein
MRKPQSGIIALIIVSAVTDFIAVSFIRERAYSWPAECFLWGLSLSQNSLLWTWAILGRSRFVVRFASAMLAMLGLTKIQASGIHSPTGGDWIVALFFGAMALAMVIVWASTRLWGMGLMHRQDGGSEDRRANLQFSLWNVMEFTTSVAVIAAVFKLAYSPDSFDGRPAQELLIGFLLGLPFAGISLLMTWVLLRPRLSLPLLLVLAGVLWTTCFVVGLIIRSGSDHRSTAVVLTVAGLSFVSLITCRLSGYRIVRHNRFEAPIRPVSQASTALLTTVKEHDPHGVQSFPGD